MPPSGRAKAELVSAYNFGFQGLTTETGGTQALNFRDGNPDKITDNPWKATSQKLLANASGSVRHRAAIIQSMSAWSPHSIDARSGGLARGHGHLLRVSVPASVEGENSDSSIISLAHEGVYAVFGTVDFRFWLYVREGGVSIGSSEGFKNKYTLDNAYDAAKFSEGTGTTPWRHIRKTFAGRNVARNSFRTLSFGADPERDTEYFIALPYLSTIGLSDEAQVGNHGGYTND